MGDPTRRIDQYVAKTTALRSSTDLTVQLGNMTANAAHVFNSIVQMEGQVRQCLNEAGVSVIQYPFYLCFGRQIWAKIRRGMGGESLRAEAAVLIAYWVAQGLQQSILQAIRSDVFNVAAPVAP